MATPRRLLFGDVADAYDRHRPTYPGALIDDVVELAALPGGQRALEVGAGTGKATVLFAARGVPVLALEPSPAMAAIAGHNCARHAAVQIVESDFERWDPAGGRFGLVYAAQAWHWVDRARRYRLARRALDAGGLLAVFMNRPAWGRSALRDALREVYAAVAPGLDTDNPMHPANEAPAADEDWSDQIAAAPGFIELPSRRYAWSLHYTAADYVGMLSTLSEIRLLDEARRRRLLDAVGEVIGAHDDRLAMPMVTLLYLARAV